jgi:transcriptional regulator with XRE-family HTH domain
MKLQGILGINVQRFRRKKNLSQEQLALIAGRTRGYMSGLEAGRRNVTLDTLEVLAAALDVEASDLIREPSNERSVLSDNQAMGQAREA